MLKETLNKSHHKIVCTSCLHIFRQPAQKILVMRQHYCGLFVQPDKKSDGAICTNDLISVSLIISDLGEKSINMQKRFNQCFLNQNIFVIFVL